MTPPPPLNFDSGNLQENWKKWRQCFELYMKGTGLDSKPEECRIAVFVDLQKYNKF